MTMTVKELKEVLNTMSNDMFVKGTNPDYDFQYGISHVNVEVSSNTVWLVQDDPE